MDGGPGGDCQDGWDATERDVKEARNKEILAYLLSHARFACSRFTAWIDMLEQTSHL